MPGNDVILVVDNVHATYNHAVVALHDVGFAVRRGEIHALLGANGAGKTTVLKAVSNLLPAERGQVNGRHDRCSKAATSPRSQAG